MGSSTSKFRKYLQHGDEYAALHLYNNNSELRKGLDPNLSYGEAHLHDTPMHYASMHAMKSLLRIFLYELGGNPNKKNSRNETAMHCVCMVTLPATTRSFLMDQRRLECLTLILQWRGGTLKDGQVEKADLYSLDEKGNTVLHYAASSGLAACVELLVAHNGPLFVENAKGQTPCDCAENCGRSNIALFLESKMVFSNDGGLGTDEEVEDIMTEIIAHEAYSGLRAQDLQEAKDQLLVETSDMLRIPLFTAEALLRNHEWSREQLLESWMENAIKCCEKCGVVPPPSVYHDRPLPAADSLHSDLNAPSSRTGYQTADFREVFCDICASMMAQSVDVVSVSCEHQFCKLCWERYLNGKILDGEIHNITCPAYGCTKLVPVDFIEMVVSRDMARKYLQFDIKAFVESNPTIKWCPYPGCGRAVRLPENEVTSPVAGPSSGYSRAKSLDTSHAVDCGNGHYFCWECLGEAHEPSSCEHWKTWFEKIAEVKPEELNNTEEETECAANYLWLVTNSKPCPNCRSPIQKNEGCNHMKCSKCKHDFCWVCQESWKKHSSATGGYFRCNRYEIVKKIEECNDATKSEAEARNLRMQELNRFMHYYSRFKNHDNSYKLEEPLLNVAKEKMMVLARAVTDQETANNETRFVEDAVRQLLKARRVLKCSYIYGYYLDDTGYKKTIFEFMQTELEECTESLSQMIARPYLRTPRTKIISTSNLVQRKRHEFAAAIVKGLIPPDRSPALRKKKRKEMDDDLRRALLASVRDVDPNNPWVIDKSGKHTNIAALFDWPLDDSDESDHENEHATTEPPPGICMRAGCDRVRVYNPRTGLTQNYCSHRCMRLDKLPQQSSEDDVDPSEFFTDYQLDLLRAMEMSRLQFVQEMRSLQEETSWLAASGTNDSPSVCHEQNNSADGAALADIVHDVLSAHGEPCHGEPRHGELRTEPTKSQEDDATAGQAAMSARRFVQNNCDVIGALRCIQDENIEMSLNDPESMKTLEACAPVDPAKDVAITQLDHSPSRGGSVPSYTSTFAELDHSPSRGGLTRGGSVPSYTSTFAVLDDGAFHRISRRPDDGAALFRRSEPEPERAIDAIGAKASYAPVATTSYASVATTSYAPLGTTSYASVATTSYAPVATTSYAPVATTSYAPVATTSYAPVATTSYASVATTSCATVAPSSQFGPIKDISVANLVSNDQDKTRNFNSKNFHMLFRPGMGDSAGSGPSQHPVSEDFTNLRRKHSGVSGRPYRDGFLGHITRSVAEQVVNVRDSNATVVSKSGDADQSLRCRKSGDVDRDDTAEVVYRSERTCQEKDKVRERGRHYSDHHHRHRHERSIHASLSRCHRDDLAVRRYSTTELADHPDHRASSEFPATPASALHRSHCASERRKCYSYAGTYRDKQWSRSPMSDSFDVWLPRTDLVRRRHSPPGGSSSQVQAERPGASPFRTDKPSDGGADAVYSAPLTAPFHRADTSGATSEAKSAPEARGSTRVDKKPGSGSGSISESTVYV